MRILGRIRPAPVVDLASFRFGDDEQRRTVAAQLDAVCRDSGFLTVTGHGVPRQVCTDVLDAFGAFFDLPLQAKRQVVVEDPAANRGFSELGKEGLAYSRGEETPPDLFEAFNVGREDSVGPYYDEFRSFYAPNVWPEAPPGLREAWLAYEDAVASLETTLLEAMALALDLPVGWFVERSERAIVTTRAINYERAPGATEPETGQMRMGAHTDYGIVTILLADDVPGLQVYRDGSWWDVATPEGAFVCNIGDMLARWTNDRWTSTLHRVVPPPAHLDGPVRRRSIARFLDCAPDLVVECIPSCIEPGNRARYEPVVAGEWLLAKVGAGRERRPAQLPANAP